MRVLERPATSKIAPYMIAETITPDLAAKYLTRNKRNRPFSDRYARYLAAAIRRGEWNGLNGESIKFTENGDLCDGQHRLNAVIKAGIATTMLVVRGLGEGAFDTLDSGKKRSAADVMALHGEKNYVVLAANARTVAAIEAGGEFGRVLTTPEVQAALERHPTLRDWVNRYTSLKTIGRVAVSVVPAVVTLGAERSGAEVGERFLTAMNTGADLPSDSPILLLRDRLITAKAARTRLKQIEMAGYTIKAWNAYVTGRPMKLLRFGRDEQFPLIA